ncbi:anti-phage dCTP deaminase [Aliikangiella coralliicola]|uniref:dCMP deaminase family protein n=1 Tax=Aliikangiella coralliicola TaxID=2592383 RepID=A0A545UH10_9GAMM|nr:anti-phage dCTP deaminase [Aliikangiella coralliicola]TQV88703.1 dCMP deaminase family protein [Aliikangiella coralliicola]
MSNPSSKVAKINSPIIASEIVNNPTKDIKDRKSQELVIGLCGAVGSGLKCLKESLTTQLESHGYIVEHIRLSDLIIEFQEAKPKGELKALNGFERYKKLQDLGDQLRLNNRSSILAELAINKIIFLREKRFGHTRAENDDGPLRIKEKMAYIIDQVKHPGEIEILNEIYRNNFYLVGLLRTEDERRKNLKDEQMSETQIGILIERDRKASEKHGQQVQDSLHKADYFIRNIDIAEKITKSVERFIKLIHGTNHITPSKDETGMYTAYSASLRSACLSRQVGAAITDENGTVISTGCNDVPRYSGGLYNSDVSEDKRCFNHGRRCHNDKHKKLLELEIQTILNNYKVNNAKEIAASIINESKAKALIEYSRAIHAEMDAITSISRSTGSSTVGKILYCTTYPCHICARHIVAAGIERVVYIEPYEKSLALQLHGDSICHPENQTKDPKVLLENFEGVSPLRYKNFFGFNKKRKDENGEAISYIVVDSAHVDPQYLDSYLKYELKIVKELKSEFPDYIPD